MRYFILKDQIELFKYGLKILEKITPGNLNIGVNKNQEFLNKELDDFNKNIFSGPHPSGNVGVQIHHIDPINIGESVWIIRPEDVCIIGNLFLEGEFTPTRTLAVSGPPINNPKYFRTVIGAKLQSILNLIDFKNGIQCRIINGDVLTGKTVEPDSYIGFYNNNISVLKEGNNYKLFGWIPFINNSVPSIYRSSFSWLNSSKPKDYDTNLNGEERAFVVTGEIEKVFPMDIYINELARSIVANDVDEMEQLGIYECDEEDAQAKGPANL